MMIKLLPESNGQTDPLRPLMLDPKNGSHSAKRAQVSSNFLGRRGMIFATI
jgi:hypothetical protein